MEREREYCRKYNVILIILFLCLPMFICNCAIFICTRNKDCDEKHWCLLGACQKRYYANLTNNTNENLDVEAWDAFGINYFSGVIKSHQSKSSLLIVPSKLTATFKNLSGKIICEKDIPEGQYMKNDIDITCGVKKK